MTADSDWSIQELAAAAGTTSRTLRHYDHIGLLKPSRVGSNGYRYYDQERLVRLQRILLLRELGLGLEAIARVLAGEQEPVAALRVHLELLERELERVSRQICSVRTTLRKLKEGEKLVADETFEGFDHTRYKDEVIERWGEDAYRRSDDWYRSLSEKEKDRFEQDQSAIARDFARARSQGLAAGSEEVQEIAASQYDWVASSWQRKPDAKAFAGLGEMYVSDPRFTAHYDRHGEGTARFVRDAMKVYAERNLK